MRDLVGETFSNRYRLVARVAGGGMGDVYRAHDLLLDRAVAVKVLQPGLANDPELVGRFKAEARAAARLTHPNVVAVYDWGEESERTYYMVMEFVPGTDLRDVLVGRGRLEPAQAASIVADVCEALAAAHESGLVHRDVKPENVLIAPGGKVKVADFGIAAVADSDRTAPGGVIPGTLRYLAPEQARGGHAGPAADIWAAGAMLYELVTGTPPHQGSGAELLRRRAEEPLAPPSEQVPGLSGDIDEIVARACAIDPRERWDDASDMAQALRRAGVRSLPDAPSLDELLHDVTGEIRLMDMEPTSLGDRHEHRRGGRTRRVLVRRLIVVALAIALLAGASQAVGTFLEPRSVKVPSLVGLSKQRALNRAQGLDLKVEVVDKRHHPDIKRGAILSQDPDSGVLKEGMTIKVVVSSGPPRWEVPSVVGATLEAATTQLKASRFKVGGVERAYSTEPAGTVIEQSPTDGKLPLGSSVALVVSKGPETLSLPDVAGMSPSEAKSTLRSAGFAAEMTTDYSDTVEEGVVIGTNPPGGSAIAEGSPIEVIVSAGPRFEELTMPDVRNMSVDSARAQLEGMGLRVEVVEGCTGGTIVAETDPIAGTRIRENDKVALFVC
ncbi:MAG TPA: Stk1 family PASTA domain-containing Ser/Thr kinase [Actinomycetota bacterium]|jgi:serine/threonine-protein kinase